VAAIGTAVRLALIGSGWTDRLVIADDTFYYFQIARNVAIGAGPTFDGLTPTNGFHPLWLLALVPIFAATEALGGGPWIPVRLALTACAALDLLSGWLLHRLIRSFGFPRAAFWASALWFMAPPTLLLSLRGLESAVAAAMVMLHLTVLVHVVRRTALGPSAGALLGASVGLAFLARTDNGVLVPLAVCCETLALIGMRRLPWPQAIRFLVIAGATAMLVTAPSFAWNVATFGTPLQVSGAIKMVSPDLGGHADRIASAYHLPGWVVTLLTLGSFVWRPIFLALGQSGQWPAVFLLTAVAAGTWAVLVPALLRNLRKGPPELAALAAGCAAYLAGHAVLYSLVTRFYADWYALAPWLLALLLFVGLGAEPALAAASAVHRRWIGALLAAVAVAVLARFFVVSGVQPRAHEEWTRGAFGLIANRTPNVRTIGCYHGNTGAWGYFGREIAPFRIVNLDGLVNNKVLETYRAGTYFEYIDQTMDLVVVSATEPFEHLLGPSGTVRFHERFPRWSQDSYYYGPRRGPSAGTP
jgi:hypothetical protein